MISQTLFENINKLHDLTKTIIIRDENNQILDWASTYDKTYREFNNLFKENEENLVVLNEFSNLLHKSEIFYFAKNLDFFPILEKKLSLIS